MRQSFVKYIAEILWYRLKSIFLLLYLTWGVVLCEYGGWNEVSRLSYFDPNMMGEITFVRLFYLDFNKRGEMRRNFPSLSF